MAEKLDPFVLLRHLDQKDFNLYKTFSNSDTDRKELDKLLAFNLPLWMSGAQDESDHAELIFRFNRMANEGWWSYKKHPQLQAKLLACTSLGYPTRHAYSKPSRMVTAKKLFSLIRETYPDAKEPDVIRWCRLNKETDLIGLIHNQGIQEKEAEEIINEYHRFVTEAT